MDFTRLNTNRLISDSRKIDYTYQMSIHPCYQEFLNFFSDRKNIGQGDMVVAAHMIYGRMPTMLRLNIDDMDGVLRAVNRIKEGGIVNLGDLDMLRDMLNNSMVGTSKLLHFLDPGRFAIWDSRIFRYIKGADGQSGISKAINYLHYLGHVTSLIDDDDFSKVHNYVQDQMRVVHTPLRTAEIVMFETDKLNVKRTT